MKLRIDLTFMLVVAILTAILAVQASVQVFSIRSNEATFTGPFDRHRTARAGIEQFKSILLEVTQTMIRLSMKPVLADEATGQFETIRNRLKANWMLAESVFDDPTMLPDAVIAARARVDVMGAFLSRAEEAMARGTPEAISALLEEWYSLLEPMDRAATLLQRAIDQSDTRAFENAQAEQDWLLRFATAVSIGGLVLLIVTHVLVAFGVVRPLRRVTRTMLRLAEGDLRPISIPGCPATEISQIVAALEVFRENAIIRQETERCLVDAKDRAETALVELRATQDQLVQAEKMASLGGLVAGVAHELNTPVGITLTAATDLSDKLADVEKAMAEGTLKRSGMQRFLDRARALINLVLTNGDRTARLVNGFKQLAVDQSGEDRRRFDICDYLGDVLAGLEGQVREAGHELGFECKPGISMDSYPGGLVQVISGLVLNAVEHGYPDGRLGGQITIAVRPAGSDALQILVRDDGTGMPPEVAASAFEPFVTTRRHEGHTGLGLHLVFNVVTQRLGGTIAFEPVDTGTCVRLELPRQAPADDEAVRPAPGQQAPARAA